MIQVSLHPSTTSYLAKYLDVKILCFKALVNRLSKDFSLVHEPLHHRKADAAIGACNQRDFSFYGNGQDAPLASGHGGRDRSRLSFRLACRDKRGTNEALGI
jgi:hypothetical protein